MQKSTILLFLMVATLTTSLHSMERQIQVERRTQQHHDYLNMLRGERNCAVRGAVYFSLMAVGSHLTWSKNKSCSNAEECGKATLSAYSIMTAGILALDAAYTQYQIMKNS